MAEYERRQPEQSLLHQVIGEQLESFLSNARERCEPVARFVERELRAYLECGVLAHGFLRVHCDGCGHDRLVAFSCKGRGFCPSCGGRRMADTAAHLVDHVLPEVPVRQWVLTLPYPLRYRCAWDARLMSEVLRAFIRALFADQRRRARADLAIRGGRCASVTFIQRFGSALNLTPHFHSLVLDGVYPGPTHNPGRFVPLPPPETEDVARVMAGTARRVMRLLEMRGLERSDDPLASEEPLLATLMAASIRSRIATGQRAGSGMPGASREEAGCAVNGAAIRKKESDRLEGIVGRQGSGGELLEGKRGVGAAPRLLRASNDQNGMREGPVSSSGQALGLGGSGSQAEPKPAQEPTPLRRPPSARRLRWADLLRIVFELDALRCPVCSGKMRVLATITQPDVARRILKCLALQNAPCWLLICTSFE